MPRGAALPDVDKTGVHRKTKMYMQLSTMLWNFKIIWIIKRFFYFPQIHKHKQCKLHCVGYLYVCTYICRYIHRYIQITALHCFY
jgi:hypothetical protein